MFSKRLLYLPFCALLLTAVGCTNYLNGKKQEKEVIQLSDERFVCLRTLPANIKKLTMGEVTEPEIRESFDCAGSALDYFSQRTKGSGGNIGDAYSIQDMRAFFGKYFLKENNIGAELAKELFKLKKAFFGGSDDWMTKAELKELVQFLALLKEEIVVLAPHMKVLLLKETSAPVHWNAISKASDQLRTSIQKLLRKISLTRSDYSFEDMKNLFSGMSDFLTGEKPFMPYNNLAEWVPLVEAIKKVLIGSHVQFAGYKDWELAVDNLVDLYAIFLRYVYIVQHQGFENRQDVRQMSQFVQQIFNLLDSSYQMSKSGEIPFSDIDSLIDQVFTRFENPLGLSAGGIKETYRMVIVRILEPHRNGDTRGMRAFTRTHLSSLKRELNVWRLNQSFIDNLAYNGKGVIAQDVVWKSYDSYPVARIVQKALDNDLMEQEALRKSWRDFGLLLKMVKPMVFNSQGRYVVSYDKTGVQNTWGSLTSINLIRVLSRAIMIGYGDKNSLEMNASTIKMEDFIRAYDDFKTMGLELKAFDPRNSNTAKRSFMEANFFTFSGNGDDRMDLLETHEFVSILVGAGLGTSTQIAQSMKAPGCQTSELDVFGYYKNREDCFKAELHKNFAAYFDNLPGIVDFVGRMTPAEWSQFYGILSTATRVSDPYQNLIETADLRVLVVILHYLESVMSTYDVDRSQGLSLDEIHQMMPRFGQFLRSTQPVKLDAVVENGFAYMLIYGRKPSALELSKFAIMKRFTKVPEAGRVNLLRVLSVFKDELNNKKN